MTYIIALLLSYFVQTMPIVACGLIVYAILSGLPFTKGLSDTQGYLLILGYFYGPMSLYAFIAIGTDKLIAILNRKQDTGIMRISERSLHFIEWFCGWPGSFVAQRLFRHKVSKLLYQLEFWPIVIIHLSYLVGKYASETEMRTVVAGCWVAAAVGIVMLIYVGIQRHAIEQDKIERESIKREWEANREQREQEQLERALEDWDREQRIWYGDDRSKWDELREKEARRSKRIRDEILALEQELKKFPK
jgi:uncharacterized membrane protein YsdA (DUF1294 family)